MTTELLTAQRIATLAAIFDIINKQNVDSNLKLGGIEILINDQIQRDQQLAQTISKMKSQTHDN